MAMSLKRLGRSHLLQRRAAAITVRSTTPQDQTPANSGAQVS